MHKEELCVQMAPRICPDNGKQVSGDSGMCEQEMKPLCFMMGRNSSPAFNAG